MSETTKALIYGMFPYSTILAMHATSMEPTYKSLHLAMTQLNANAASVPSPHSDGLLGHLVLTLGQTAYASISAGNIGHPTPPPLLPILDIPNTGAAAPTDALLAKI
jgi:hypothetical protein